MARSYLQGKFKPLHPEKYKGDITKIRYMSSYELQTHQFLDNNPNILEWNSEEVVIPYIKPTDGKIHRYYVDIWVKFKDKQGKIHEELWEIKPSSQTKMPRRVGKRKKQQLYEALQYEVNRAKWMSAMKYCEQRGWKFRLVTEHMIFN